MASRLDKTLDCGCKATYTELLLGHRSDNPGKHIGSGIYVRWDRCETHKQLVPQPKQQELKMMR